VDELVGRVLVHVDLLEDHLTLSLEISGAEERVLQHVAHVLDGHRQVAVQHARVA